MTDKQQIEDIAKIVSTDCIIKDKEQMARIIAFDLCKQSYHSDWYGNEAQCYSDNNFHDCKKIKVVVDKLYNAGYCRVPENAVVLTREEFDRLNSCIKSEEEVRAIMEQQMLPMVRELTDKEVGKKLDTVTALVRKETADKIFDILYQWLDLEQIEKYGFVTIQKFDFLRKFREIFKQFGVEVQ